MASQPVKPVKVSAKGPTIVDVAQLAGVSTASVSRVVNRNSRVDPDIARRVKHAIEELGYQPSRAAQAMRTRHSRAWALLVPDVRNPFFTELVRGIEDVAYDAGYSLLLCNTDEDAEKEQSYLDLALAERVSGIVLAPTHPAVAAMSEVLSRNVPVVTVDRRLHGYDLDTVLVDNAAGARQAVEHLLARGYKRLACISGPTDTTTGHDRLAGFHQALGRNDMPVRSDHVRVGDFRESSGFREMQALLATQDRPDAVLICNNLMTLGALEAVLEMGLVIPDDIAVVGFDDSSWNEVVRPPLTSVAQPTYELGRETARLLLNRIEGYQGPARHVTLSPLLRVRASTVTP